MIRVLLVDDHVLRSSLRLRLEQEMESLLSAKPEPTPS
jgi:hypothetical protein